MAFCKMIDILISKPMKLVNVTKLKMRSFTIQTCSNDITLNKNGNKPYVNDVLRESQSKKEKDT